MKPTIAVDFDGVINSYVSEFNAYRIPDPPMPGAIEFLAQLQGAGYHVAIFSTRANSIAAVDLIRNYLWRHLDHENYIRLRAKQPRLALDIPKLQVTNEKPKAKLYIDDRGYRFTGEFPSLKYVKQLAENPGKGTPPPEAVQPPSSSSNEDGEEQGRSSGKRRKSS